MATIIQNLNTIMTVKSHLNFLLEKYGIEGGNDFSSYPRKFEALLEYLSQANESYDEEE